MRCEARTYDRMGRRYSVTRAADPRIAAAIDRALGDARGVLNVGAGSYEPTDRDVIAVEPSAVMIAQRPAGSAPAIQASAESLPLEDDIFDATMAIVTDHHWSDRPGGMSEMLRVTKSRILVVNVDPALAERFWMTRDYLPCFMDLVPERYREPGCCQRELRDLLGDVEIESIPVPRDCLDGFYQAFWRRPDAYLEEPVRNNISVFHRLPGEEVRSAVERLRWDLDHGVWESTNGHLLKMSDLDVGLRLAVCTL
jgi:ubiquinone/menaquinone biosynthesis C-methylase UbiE